MPMSRAMAPSISPRTAAHALTSCWRGHALVAGVAGLASGLVLTLGGLGLPAFVGTALCTIVVAAAVVASALVVRMPDAAPAVLLAAATEAAPAALVRASLAVTPAIGAGMLARLGAHVHPLLGLLLVPVAFAAVALVLAPVGLALAPLAGASSAWTPEAAVRALRPRMWRATGIAVVVALGISMACVPVVLGAMLAGAVLGPVGVFAFGFAVAAPVPLVGVVVHLASQALLGDGDGAGAGDAGSGDAGADAGSAHEVPAGGHAADPQWNAAAGAHGAAQVHAAAAVPGQAGAMAPAGGQAAAAAPVGAWVPGPAWQVQGERGAPWGAWMQLPVAATIAVGVAFDAAAPPNVRIARQDGTWRDAGTLDAAGSVVVQVEAGATWLQVEPVTAADVLHAVQVYIWDVPAVA